MNQPPTRTPRAGGALILLAILVGAGAGVAFGQPTIGILAGIAVGLVLATLIWLNDRKAD
jgi:UDP-N-acetylmuramyl pentapeptide phosphotransferase/UDP-N-acetylglucosamine-1-phosphate transferase